jgi:chorismate synthase
MPGWLTRRGSGKAGKRGRKHDGRGALHAPVTPDASDPRGGFRRPTNNAGGLEGGITTGEPVVVKVAMKPIATLMSPLATVDLVSGEPAKAVSERSDVTAVPAMGVIAEAVMALVLADAMLEKFGGDSLAEMRRNYTGYVAALGSRWASSRPSAEG